MDNREKDKLGSHLKDNFIQEPSCDFTNNIMSKIEKESIYEYEPLLTKKTWIWIMSSLVLVIFLPSVFYNRSMIQTEIYNWLEIPNMEAIMPLITTIVIGLALIFVLLLVDNVLLKTRKVSFK